MALTLIPLVFIFLFGLCIGSFLNVLIYRLPRSLAITGRSFCPKCKKKISWRENIPLLSFVFLGGRCRYCHSPIGWQYPLVELSTGALFVWVWWWIKGWCGETFNCYIVILLYCYIVASLVAILAIDLKHKIIPDQIIYPAIIVVLIFQFLNQLSNQQYSNLTISNYVFSALGAGLFFLILHLVTHGRGMGLGDVKLAFLMGLVLGFPKIAAAFYLAFLTGAFGGVILILLGRKRFGQQIPFGPFLVGATMGSLFWGDSLWQIFQKASGLL